MTLASAAAPLTLGRAWDVLEGFFTAVAAFCPELDGIEAAGGVRRFEPLPAPLIVTARADDPPGAISAIANIAAVTRLSLRSGRRIVVGFRGHDIDVRVATADEYGTTLFAATGPEHHVEQIQRRRGPRPSATEAEIYAQAGLMFVPPEIRDAPDALEAAVQHRVPDLVTRDDIRGDLHMHTSSSDGQDTAREMVTECCALGYQFMAITDHSEHAAASRTVSPEALVRQRHEIERLRREFPQIEILHGIEVDILPDGTLDCADQVLESLDIVLASLHEPAGQDGAQLTARCLRAIRHPLVSIVTHPSNRLVGRRPGYDLDYPALYAAAAETGTVLEVDGGPGHLDLDGPHAREAVAAGVTVSIDSDCHRARSLERQMRLGVGTARRGWVGAGAVLNTRPIAEVRAFVARKRASGA